MTTALLELIGCAQEAYESGYEFAKNQPPMLIGIREDDTGVLTRVPPATEKGQPWSVCRTASSLLIEQGCTAYAYVAQVTALARPPSSPDGFSSLVLVSEGTPGSFELMMAMAADVEGNRELISWTITRHESGAVEELNKADAYSGDGLGDYDSPWFHLLDHGLDKVPA